MTMPSFAESLRILCGDSTTLAAIRCTSFGRMFLASNLSSASANTFRYCVTSRHLPVETSPRRKLGIFWFRDWRGVKPWQWCHGMAFPSYLATNTRALAQHLLASINKSSAGYPPSEKQADRLRKPVIERVSVATFSDASRTMHRLSQREFWASPVEGPTSERHSRL